MHLGFGIIFRPLLLEIRVAPSLRRCLLIACSILALSCLNQTVASESFTGAKPTTVADGSLNDCVALNIDRFIAVGDRGLILTTSNGGRTWESRVERGPETLYGVNFIDSQRGLIVGGTIEPLIGRSTGVVLRTMDGGVTWEKLPTKLSRLTGIAQGAAGQWIAWGDWSTDYQTSVFESIDGGVSWSAIPVPTGHIQTVGVYTPAQSGSPRTSNQSAKGNLHSGNDFGMASAHLALVIDRLGKVFTTKDMIRFEQLQLPTSPYQTYRFCRCIDGTWWIGGEAGVLYRSLDGITWEHSFVPGTLQDRELLEFGDISGSNGHLWLVGSQGRVCWYSPDNGASWQVQKTDGALPLNSVEAGSDGLVLACGEGGRVIVSRNGGSSWTLSHESVSKVAALNFASTYNHIGWDVLSYLQRESRQATAAIVVHDQGIFERSSSNPESSVRVSVAGGRAGLVHASAWRSLPISDSYRGARATDHLLYGDIGTLHSPPTSGLVRRLVQSIRTYRPEVLISDCPESYTPLQAKLSEALQLAATWSGRTEAELFSKESGIPNEPWSIVRTFSRGTKTGGLHYPRSMLLQTSNLILGEVIAPIVNTVKVAQPDSFPEDEQRVYYRFLGSKSTSLREPLDGLRHLTGSELNDRSLANHRKDAVLKTSGWFEPRGLIPANNFNQLVRDRAWEDRVTAAMKGLELDSKAPVLYELGIQNRRLGNWNHWSSAMEMLLAECTSSGLNTDAVVDPAGLQITSQQEVAEAVYAEAAMLELMKYTGSAEVAKIIADQMLAEDQKAASDSGVSVAVASSPFAKYNEVNAVQPASYNHAPRRIPITHSGGLPEYHRLLSKLPIGADWKRREHRYGWIIASRYRSILANQAVQGITVADYPSLWPLQSNALLEWQGTFQQEKNAARILAGIGQGRVVRDSDRLAPKVANTDQRPFLDGKRADNCWANDPHIVLRDPWGADSGTTSCYLAQDAEFIYVFAEASESPGTSANKKERQHDLLQSTQEQMRLRIDLDRDYATWFEFGWGRNGETSEQLNDMVGWNPNWYIATSETPQGWSAEIAIPKSAIVNSGISLTPSNSLGTNVWAVSAIHLHPDKGARSSAPSVSDRFQIDNWTLLEFSPESIADNSSSTIAEK